MCQGSDSFHQFVGLEWLCNVSVIPRTKRDVPISRGCISSYGNTLRSRSFFSIKFPNVRNQRISVVFRQADIGYNYIRPDRLKQLNRRLYGIGRQHSCAVPLQHELQYLPRVGVVSTTRICLPRSGKLSDLWVYDFFIRVDLRKTVYVAPKTRGRSTRS